MRITTLDISKKVCGWMAAAILSVTGDSVLHAQDTRESAAAGLRAVDPKEMDPGYKIDAKFAQKLVDEALAKHSEVILLAIHAGAPKYDIIASNFGRIGKLGDEDDLRVITKGTKNLEMNKTGTHFEDELPLKTRGGKRIGAIGVVFNYKPGDDKAALDKIATEIQKEMQAQIISSKTLFGPVK
jgi:iron complex outermembrane receptor protein